MMGRFCCLLVLVRIYHPIRIKAFLFGIIFISLIQTTRGLSSNSFRSNERQLFCSEIKHLQNKQRYLIVGCSGIPTK